MEQEYQAIPEKTKFLDAFQKMERNLAMTDELYTQMTARLVEIANGSKKMHKPKNSNEDSRSFDDYWLSKQYGFTEVDMPSGKVQYLTSKNGKYIIKDSEMYEKLLQIHSATGHGGRAVMKKRQMKPIRTSLEKLS